MLPTAQIDRIAARFEEIEAQLAAGHGDMVKLAKERAQIKPVADALAEYRAAEDERVSLEAMANDSDAEMAAMAREELQAVKEKLPELERALKLLLIPRDSADEGSAILEVRAGTGGAEAALFAGDLVAMYRRYAMLQGWRVTVVSISESDLGGMKEAILLVEGQGVFAKLKYESGVHRVQRVPQTETQGRIHTSAATVAVLPEAEDVEIEVKDSDLRIDVYRASGAGGQHVNKTESAVRITHIPTGVVAASQEEKSQHKNKAIALKMLKARLYDAERQRVDSARAADRKDQVGSGDRSERIRTYNFPQGRVTDHRINLTLYKLDRVIAGDDLSELVNALAEHDQAARLAALDGQA